MSAEKRDDVCTCAEGGHDEHSCPFQEDVNNDHETLCTCCPHCEHECAMDI